MAESKKTDSKVLERNVVINDNENAKKEETKSNLKRIYLGPNLIQLTKYTVFDGELPTHLKEVTDKCPSVEKLIVPVANFVEVEKKCSTKGTLEHKRYEEIVDFLRERSE